MKIIGIMVMFIGFYMFSLIKNLPKETMADMWGIMGQMSISMLIIFIGFLLMYVKK